MCCFQWRENRSLRTLLIHFPIQMIENVVDISSVRQVSRNRGTASIDLGAPSWNFFGGAELRDMDTAPLRETI
jgi:hypothetical protein